MMKRKNDHLIETYFPPEEDPEALAMALAALLRAARQ